MKIYTKTGDAGETSLLGGKRVGKNCLEIEVVGELDELNAALGLVLVVMIEPVLRLFIKEIQKDLFKVGSEIASLQTVIAREAKQTQTISNEETKKLETKIDELWGALPELKNFILPGGSEAGARLHLARAVCRRAERRLAELGKKFPARPELYQYLNRLSDFLFTAARWVNNNEKIKEEPV